MGCAAGFYEFQLYELYLLHIVEFIYICPVV